MMDSIPDQPSLPRRSRLGCGAACCRNGATKLFHALGGVGMVGLILIVLLFVQLQCVTYEVHQDHAELAQLKHDIQNQTASQIQQLSHQVQTQKDLTVYQMAGTFTLLTCLITMFHMVSHLRDMYEPLIQRKIVAILWMSPIYSVTSFLSLLLPLSEGYLSIVKDFYEAYVIYTFLSFLIAVLGRGDREAVVQVLAKHADHLPEPTNCCGLVKKGYYHHPPPPTTTNDLESNEIDETNYAKAHAVLWECQVCAMQFVLVRPITSILSFLVYTLTKEHDTSQQSIAAYFISPEFFITMVENVSVFFAFSGLLKFYHAVAEDLAWLQPFQKFLAIKGIVFLTFWQGLLISILVPFLHTNDNEIVADGDNTTNSSSHHANAHDQAAAIQNLLICVEMLFFSLAHWCVFPVDEWEPNFARKQLARPGLGLRDFATDVRTVLKANSGNGRNNSAVPPIQDDNSPNSSSLDMPPTDIERNGNRRIHHDPQHTGSDDNDAELL